jgi:6-phosphogluconolactonase (cycloisomerase 2 family)
MARCRTRRRVAPLVGALAFALTGVSTASAAEGPITYMGCLTGDSNVAAASAVGTNSCLGLATVAAEGAGTGLDGARGVAVSPDGLSVYAVSQDDDAVTRFNRAADGSLTYQGCITAETGLVGTNGCVGMPTTQANGNQTALDQPTVLAVSPAGDSLYVSSGADSAIVVFDRAAGGALTYRECLSSETGTIGAAACGVAGEVQPDGEDTGFGTGPSSIAVSPDGLSVYTTSATDAAITRFDRAANGSLTWRECVSADSNFNTPNVLFICQGLGTLGADGANTGLDRPVSVAVSPDGDSVYAGTADDASVVRLDRAASGGLTYQGCITGDAALAAAGGSGSNGCVGLATVGGPAGNGNDTGLDNLQSLVVAPDGEDVYASSLDDAAIARFARAAGGSITYADCITADSSVAAAATTGVNDCAGISATDAGLQSVRAIAISPDGDSIYGASQSEGSVTRFDRSADGTLSHQGCITSDQDVSPTGVTSPSGCLGLATTTTPTPADTGLDFLHSIMVSPDGDSVYAVARDDAAVIRLNREDDPPDTAIDAGPQGATSDNSPAFGFSSSEPNSTFECAVDAQPFAPCGGVASGSATTPALADGSHVFRVRAGDGFGDLDASPATRNFAIDTQAPDTLFSGKPRAKVKTKKARARLTLAFTSTEPGSTFECAVGAAPFAPCASPLTAQLKAKKGKGKTHTIQVRAVDPLGNRDPSAASLSVKAIRK